MLRSLSHKYLTLVYAGELERLGLVYAKHWKRIDTLQHKQPQTTASAPLAMSCQVLAT